MRYIHVSCRFIGDKTEDWITAVDAEHRLVVGIVLVTWVSSLASCFIDNIPFTTVMVKIVAKLGEALCKLILLFS